VSEAKKIADFIVLEYPIRLRPMFAIARFTVPLADSAHFEAHLNTALDAFSQCAGFKSGEFGQNLDEPTLWSLTTNWENVGSYRRALSNNNVKMNAIPILAQAIDEPGAYEKPYSE
jgi:Antibiotic biosynthesis monooxygenase